MCELGRKVSNSPFSANQFIQAYLIFPLNKLLDCFAFNPRVIKLPFEQTNQLFNFLEFFIVIYILDFIQCSRCFLISSISEEKYRSPFWYFLLVSFQLNILLQVFIRLFWFTKYLIHSPSVTEILCFFFYIDADRQIINWLLNMP